MTLPAATLADLRREEGWSQSIYVDSLGFDSWGYGICIDKRKNPVMPRAVGELWLQLEAEGKWSALLYRFPWLSTQPDDVQRALVNMVYQLGVEGVAHFVLMLAALERGDREAAAVNALDSAWAKQTPERAARVSTLIRGHGPEGDD
jgi:lysozyme